jgi:hypothetical protein
MPYAAKEDACIDANDNCSYARYWRSGGVSPPALQSCGGRASSDGKIQPLCEIFL